MFETQRLARQYLETRTSLFRPFEWDIASYGLAVAIERLDRVP